MGAAFVWASLAIAVVGVLALVYNAMRIIRWYDLRTIAKRVRTPIAEVRAGTLVKLTGVVRHGDETLRAPVSDRECAAWTLEVGQLTLNEHNQWRDTAFPVASTKKAIRFFVEDETGRAAVEPKGAELLLVEDEKQDHRTSSEEAATIASKLVEAVALELELRSGTSIMEYAEGVLHEGERVSVVGRARWDVDLAVSGGRRLVIAQPEGGLLYITDERAVTE